MLWKPESTSLHLNILHDYAKVKCCSKRLLKMHTLFWLQRNVRSLEENIPVIICLKLRLFFRCQQSAHKWISCGLLKDKHREKSVWVFVWAFVTTKVVIYSWLHNYTPPLKAIWGSCENKAIIPPFSWLYKWKMDSSRLSQGVHSRPAWRHLTNCHPPPPTPHKHHHPGCH